MSGRKKVNCLRNKQDLDQSPGVRKQEACLRIMFHKLSGQVGTLRPLCQECWLLILELKNKDIHIISFLSHVSCSNNRSQEASTEPLCRIPQIFSSWEPNHWSKGSGIPLLYALCHVGSLALEVPQQEVLS